MEQFLRGLAELAACEDAHDVADAVTALLSATSATSYFFVLKRTCPSPETIDLQYLIGCDPAWSQQYVSRHWHLNDPFLNHCSNSNIPLRSGQVIPRTPGQKDILRAAEASGFRSCVAVPAHGAYAGHKAMLLVGSDATWTQGEKKLFWESGLYRAINAALLDWNLAVVRREAIAHHGLDGREIHILKLLSEGTPTNALAAALDVSVSVLYKTFQKINTKLTTSRITDAVAWARLHALF